MNHGRLHTKADILRFLFGGNATFTLLSKQTGVRFTYRVKRAEASPSFPRETYFIAVLTGADNERDYRYLGFIRDRTLMRSSRAVKTDAPSSVVFEWFFSQLRDARPELPSDLEVWHEGRCGRCGRKLTVPASITTGFGPECAGHVGVVYGTNQDDGQSELKL